MYKKIITILLVLIGLFSLELSALEVPEEFYVYNKDNQKLSETLGMTENELQEYCQKNKITFLAVNPQNTKQVRKIEQSDEFSLKIVNLSVLSDKEILDLTENLASVPNVSGKVETQNSQKYLKIEAQTKDSGGEYILTQYITVKDGIKTVLTFYTEKGESREYVEKVFNSQISVNNIFKIVVLAGIGLFALLAVVVVVFLIKEIFLNKAAE